MGKLTTDRLSYGTKIWGIYCILKKSDWCVSSIDWSFPFQAASFAVGNAAYHGKALYGKLKTAIQPLVRLLDDSVSKTRANAASKSRIMISFVPLGASSRRGIVIA